MPEYLLIIIVGLGCLLAGYLTGRTLPGRPTRAPVIEPNTQDEDEEPPEGGQPKMARPEDEDPGAALPQPGVSPGGPPAGATTVATARQVLDVADRISNPELTRRLVEAVVLLPGVSAVRPKPGDGYQPRLHEWAGREITDKPAQWKTIARTLAPGAITSEHALLRPAKVIVFESPEQS